MRSRRFAAADLDADRDVDIHDIRGFANRFTGPGGGVPQGCEPADLTGNGHVGLDDVALFQHLYTGH
ncbi:MAG: hypothetical protein C4547_09605 [Phycisphaerales bacterium]|nr:MAG: hypothetical protein C4547_09605 [Phycisphaerales bacterium]